MAITALDIAKEVTWGTYGPGALEAHDLHGVPLPPLTKKRLGDLDTDHLEAIIEHVMGPRWDPAVGSLVVIAAALILEDRIKESSARSSAG